MARPVKWILLCSVALGGIAGCSRNYDPVDVYHRGLQKQTAGDYTGASGYYKWSLERNPEYSLPMIGLAECHLQFAKENFQKENSGAATFHILEGLHWADRGINADPGNARATGIRIDLLKLKGEVDEAVKTARWGVRVQGPNAESLLLKAKTFMEAGSYDEAEVAYRQAIAVAPTNPEVRMKAGEFFEKIGKRDDALSEYEEAYRIDPNNSEVQIRITALGGGIPQSPEENKGQ